MATEPIINPRLADGGAKAHRDGDPTGIGQSDTPECYFLHGQAQHDLRGNLI
jgi:hypothetical protein